MGRSWSYNADEQFKTSHRLVQMLVQVVSRGGNFLLNIGPGPDGDFHPTAYERLKEIGGWMKINSEAIYETKPIAPFQETKLVFTQKENNIYATYLPDEDEKNMPSIVMIHSMQPKKGSKIYLLGYSQPLSWENTGKGFTINIPGSLRNKPPCQYAWTFKFEPTIN